MGEELELTDINGNVVKVAMHAAIDALTEAMRDRLPYMCSTKNSGEWVEIRLIVD
jgi:hypothetical protein